MVQCELGYAPIQDLSLGDLNWTFTQDTIYVENNNYASEWLSVMPLNKNGKYGYSTLNQIINLENEVYQFELLENTLTIERNLVADGIRMKFIRTK